ncbi:MAG: MBL fold metallo-hydrolase [Proteobacteria bacterium]|nr:MBL fold metallo-hydrolase [Pseudomonadota bacterium]NIS69777.1 MBL fold metallo-hydrolase [Pseudomonadota bacterium]
MIFVEELEGIRKFRLARTFFGRGLYYTAAYWVDGLMIDTGCTYTVQELLSALDGVTIKLIVNTHSHEDHIGANAALTRRCGAKIVIHPLGLEVLPSPRERQPLKPYQRVMWGYPDPSQGTAIGETIGTETHRFEVIHTPGHSPDHICLYEPERGWLFSGDAYIGGRDRALRADYNVWQIIRSLQRLAGLDVTLLFAGSGRVRGNVRTELLEKIHYLEDTADQVLELYRRGLGYGSIRRELFGRELPLSYVTFGHFSGKNLVRSFVEDYPTSDSA